MASDNPDNLPVVDEKRLAQILGLEKWPDGALSDRRARMAARVITDAVGGSSPESKVKNGVSWINWAIDEGHARGVLEERERWERKIASLFGMRREVKRG